MRASSCMIMVVTSGQMYELRTGSKLVNVKNGRYGCSPFLPMDIYEQCAGTGWYG